MLKTIKYDGGKMKKNGFTLIELLAVIIILAAIFAIAIPSVAKIIYSGKVKAYNLMIETVESTAVNYIKEFEYSTTVTFEYDENGNMLIFLKDLTDMKLLNAPIYDPINEIDVDLYEQILITKTGNYISADFLYADLIE